MGKIEIDIPKDMEQAFDAAFPGEDKAQVVLRLIAEGLAQRGPARSGRGRDLVETAKRIRGIGQTFTGEEIKKALDEGRP